MDELYAYSERRVRAGARPPARRTLRGDGRGRGGGGRPRDQGRGHRRGRRGRHRLRRHGAPVRRQPNCPLAVTRSACLFVVRLRDRSGHSRVRRGVRPVTRPGARGLASSTPARRPRSWPATPRRRAGSPTSSWQRSAVPAVPAARRQGTMNNTTFGTSTWTYYETIGGGQGAGPHADGPTGVHVAMSNALNTPVEALELAYPLRVERYALRPGSGGAGRHRGGDGVVREIRALEELPALGARRPASARAARRAAAASPELAAERFSTAIEIPGKDTPPARAGDVVRTETPGGGGFGRVVDARRWRVADSRIGSMCRNIKQSPQLRATCDRRRGARGRAPVRAQDQRHGEAVEGERGCVRPRGRRGRPHLASPAGRARHDVSAARSRDRKRPERGHGPQSVSAPLPA